MSCSRATDLVSVALLKGMSLLEAKVPGKRVGGPEGSTIGLEKIGVARTRSNGDTLIGRSGATSMRNIVSTGMNFKGGKHRHSRGTETDNKQERVLGIAMSNLLTPSGLIGSHKYVKQ